MVTDQDPIPPEALPPRWGLAELCDDQFVYRHSRPPIELIADCTLADGSHPGLGLCRCWELRYRYFLTDRTICRSIGRVSTREAAVDGLLECMRSIHETVTAADDAVAVGQVLERVSLAGLIPDGLSRSSASP
ncbi:hypothetical protein [Natrinema sp. H-ect4]|uniref:hypothetical protein n=1 Tax=Natrinema sp. H-ect4 TaxID=3242699 RepID=UPI0035A869ED